MSAGQAPRRWLIVDLAPGELLPEAARRLPPGSGLLLLSHGLKPGTRARLKRALRRIAHARGLVLIDEAEGSAARVHDGREIARARLRGTRLLLLSPLAPTRSHPGTAPLPRMRAAALRRLAGRQVLALGGMNSRRFGKASALGFSGWAGIDAWDARTGRTPERGST
jgi:thiamine-phosphate pyrophosphorylase